MTRATHHKMLAAATIGNILEFYDFLLFGMLMPIFSPIFFPAEDATVSLLKAYALFAVGFFTRPLGGIVFGHIGDHYGRKLALTLSIFAMAVPTVIIGILPGYDKIGIWAPIILLACRLLQGICAGGEYSGSGVMVLEHVSPKLRYVYTSIVAASASLGGLLAALVTLSFLLLPLPEWGWRLPFLLGGCIGLVGLYLRRNGQESPEFLQTHRRVSMVELIRKHRRACLVTIGVAGFAVGPFYTATVYIPSYLMSIGAFSKPTILLGNCFVLLAVTVSGVWCGRLSVGRSVRSMMLLGALLVALCAWPLFYWIHHSNIYYVVAAQTLFMLVSELFSALSLGFILQLFPPEVRYRGAAFFYNVGIALFCGTIPVIATTLIAWLHHPSAPALYIIGTAAMGAIAVWFGRVEKPATE
jgi:MHS family proline/betaine transporter-like MFS transporter